MITKETLDIANALVSGVRAKLNLSAAECFIVQEGANGRVGYSHTLGNDPAAPYLAAHYHDKQKFCFVLEVERRAELLVEMTRRYGGWQINCHGPEAVFVRDRHRDISAAVNSMVVEIRRRLNGG